MFDIDITRPAVSSAVSRLVEAVEALASEAPADVPGAQALADTAALLAARERLEAVVLERLADVSTRQLHVDDGAGSVAGWVAGRQSSLSRDDVALAGRLGRYPALAAELLAGRVSVEAAKRVVRALSSLRPHVDRADGLIDGQPGEQVLDGVLRHGVVGLVCEGFAGLAEADPRLDQLRAALDEIAARPEGQLARLEAGFLVLARHLDAGLLPGALARLVDAVLPVQLEERAEQARRRRGLDLRRNEDGSGWVLGRSELDLECGELLWTVLQAEAAVDPDSPGDTERWAQLRADGWEPGDDVPAGPRSPRARRERQHDGLRSALRRYLDSGVAGLRDKVAPHVSVTVGLDALNGAPGALPARGASGTPLPLGLVRQWWCDSSVTRFVLSLGRKVLETSHTERTLKAHERRAKHVETGGRCQRTECRCRPGDRLVPHHAQAWARSRTTSLEDSVLVCESTHHDLHSGGQTIRLRDGRWLSEHGWVEAPEPWGWPWERSGSGP